MEVKDNTVKEHRYIEFFIKEKEYELFDLQFKGVPYWQLIRFDILKKITTGKSDTLQLKVRHFLLPVISATIRDSLVQTVRQKGAVHVDMIRIRPSVCVTSTNKLDDHQYDYLTLPPDLAAEDLWALDYYDKAPAFATYTMAKAELKVIIWKIRRKFMGAKEIDASQKQRLTCFLKDVADIYGVQLNPERIFKAISYSVALHKYYKEEYCRIYRVFTPEMILVYPHYDEHMFASIAAAKDAHVKSVELQHGRINEHEAYYFIDCRKSGKILPDYLFTYGEWWSQCIQLPPCTIVVSTGNCYLEAQMKKVDSSLFSEKTITVFSGPETGRALAAFVMDCLPYLAGHGYKILYKFHPRECALWRREYPSLVSHEGIYYIDDPTVSVYDLMAQSKYFIAINSTVLFETLAFEDREIMILKRPGYEPMNPLLEIGGVHLIESETDLCDVLSGKLETRHQSSLDRACFWKEGAQVNTLKKLNEIKNNNK